MKIIDCFIFYNELDLLNYRLNILYDVVDYFIIVEATHTFAGHSKELFFQKNRHVFAKFSSKIIHIVVDDLPYKYPDINYDNREQWINEKFQRNCGGRGLSRITDLNDDDLLIISDIDEIPDPRIIKQSIISDISVVSLEMHFYYYNLNSKIKDNWYSAKLISVHELRKSNNCFETVRFINYKYIPNCGWHLSYFGDVKFIQNKLHNFSHQEFNTGKFTDSDIIANKIKTRTNLFDDMVFESSPVKSNPYLPIGYEKYLSKYYTY
jgi:beta-1,4-mannosyl-glycoprotein beta-1,4-N-acetylglucosaminyltransferase